MLRERPMTVRPFPSYETKHKHMPKQTKAKVGDTIIIKEVAYKSNMFKDGIDHQALELIGKSGTVDHVDSMGTLWGSWGSLGITKEDKYIVL